MEYSPVNLLDVTLPKRSAFVFGEEGLGLSSDDIHLCDGMLFIGMYGSVRSLNVAVAAGIVQYEYCRQWR
jgi:tRNA G18 (ribose-2'-O)-methylase SpoU